MIAQSGVDAVSLRQIGIAIGSANTTVIAYYFGAKAGLVEAILQHRLPRLEARRAELLAIADQDGTGRDLKTLIRVQCLPLFEMTDEDGRHSFAGFLGSLGRYDWSRMNVALEGSFPVSREIERRITSLLPKEVAPLLEERAIASVAILTTSLEHIDRTCPDNLKHAKVLFADALNLVHTVLLTIPE